MMSVWNVPTSSNGGTTAKCSHIAEIRAELRLQDFPSNLHTNEGTVQERLWYRIGYNVDSHVRHRIFCGCDFSLFYLVFLVVVGLADFVTVVV